MQTIYGALVSIADARCRAQIPAGGMFNNLMRPGISNLHHQDIHFAACTWFKAADCYLPEIQHVFRLLSVQLLEGIQGILPPGLPLVQQPAEAQLNPSVLWHALCHC